LAVASNTSGSTSKELFEDVLEELEKQVTKLFCVFVILVGFSFWYNVPKVIVALQDLNDLSLYVIVTL
jgi:hypothetical protein